MKEDKDGEIFTYQCEKGAIVTFVDENEYRKEERALRKYCMKSYKNLIFDVLPMLRNEQFKDGDYVFDLLTDSMFEKVYGKIKLNFFVHENVVVIKSIEPEEILKAMYSIELPVYAGIPYRNEKDLFKIKIILNKK